MDTKTKKRIPPGTPRYHRLTSENRITIRALKEEGLLDSEIARHIGCSRSTIGRELNRNKSKKGYRPKKAQELANERIAKKAASMPTVCKETFYEEYYRRQALVRKGESAEVLPLLPKRQKRRKTRDRDAKKYRNAGRGKIKDRVDIDERPKTVENRARVGHWEGDLINGLKGTGNLVTIVERMTRFTFVAYVASKESDGVMAAIIGMLASLPKDMLRTLTFDNGKEFAAFKQLEQALGLKVYFAKPYHSWERGTSENRNGIVRKVLPKGRSFDDILDAELKRIDYMLNDRPMKCLNWRTPREAFTALVKHYVLQCAA